MYRDRGNIWGIVIDRYKYDVVGNSSIEIGVLCRWDEIYSIRIGMLDMQ